MVKIQIPPEFAAVATKPTRELAVRFHVAQSTVISWRRKLGVKIPPGAPKGNRNAESNAGPQKKTHGMDGPEAIRTCLSCTEERCRGHCARVR